MYRTLSHMADPFKQFALLVIMPQTVSRHVGALHPFSMEGLTNNNLPFCRLTLRDQTSLACNIPIVLLLEQAQYHTEDERLLA